MYIKPYLIPTACVHKTNGMYSVIATKPISKNEIVAIFGGIIISRDELKLLKKDEQSMSIQIDEYKYSFSKTVHESDYINHSCEPNLGFNEVGYLVAMRDIEAEEELTFDYSMADSSSFDEFDCLCKTSSCRGKVTGNDWKLKGLNKKYTGYYLPYLQAKIKL